MKVAATSSSEAEIIAAVEAVKTSIHFRNLLEELGVYSEKHIDVYEDNQSYKMSAESLKQHKKARHYEAKLRFLQDTYHAGIVRFHQTGTEDEIADIFTKGLLNDPRWKHTEAMLKKLPEHVIESSEAAESSSSVNVPEEEKHDGVVLFEGSPDGSDEVDAKLFRPLGY